MPYQPYIISRLPAGTTPETIRWSAIPTATIDTYRWLPGYTPAATAQLVYIEGVGFILRMACAEAEPRAVYTAYNDPVYTDSCLEFFADWLGDGRYINMEMNARGALLSCVGTGRADRTPIRDLTGGHVFPVTGERTADGWSVTSLIPCSLLQSILGVEALDFPTGYTFRGNFYKCGDETAIPHFGMWHPVCADQPDFHRPADFGEMYLA